jgi:hypothetical protein
MGVDRTRELVVDDSLWAEAQAWYRVYHPDAQVKDSSVYSVWIILRYRVDDSMDQPPVMGLQRPEHRESSRMIVEMSEKRTF